MKIPFLSLLLIGAALMVIPSQTVLADDSAASGQAAPTNSAGTGTRAQRFERIKEAFAELGLTDAQKAQIKQIRTTVTDRKERCQEIMAVLTPEQKAKLRETIEEYRNGNQS